MYLAMTVIAVGFISGVVGMCTDNSDRATILSLVGYLLVCFGCMLLPS